MECRGGLRAYRVSKRLGGRLVVRNVSLEVKPGHVYALVGPNGAGKTTTLRILVGIYKPDTGFVEVCGRRRLDSKARRAIGYLPENAGVYPRLTGWEHLRFYASLYAEPHRVDEVVEKAARLSRLGRDLERKAGEYSRGMRRRLLLALVLALDTPILVLDEPTSGLDVVSAVAIRHAIREAALSGKAVLLTSHNMLEVERVADKVAFMVKGMIIEEDSPSRLLEKYGARDLEEAFVRAVEAAGLEPT